MTWQTGISAALIWRNDEPPTAAPQRTPHQRHQKAHDTMPRATFAALATLAVLGVSARTPCALDYLGSPPQFLWNPRHVFEDGPRHVPPHLLPAPAQHPAHHCRGIRSRPALLGLITPEAALISPNLVSFLRLRHGPSTCCGAAEHPRPGKPPPKDTRPDRTGPALFGDTRPIPPLSRSPVPPSISPSARLTSVYVRQQRVITSCSITARMSRLSSRSSGICPFLKIASSSYSSSSSYYSSPSSSPSFSSSSLSCSSSSSRS